MKTPGLKAFKKGSFLFCGGDEQSPAICHSAIRVSSYIPLRMQGSPLIPGCGEELGGEGPIWSDAGPGGAKDAFLWGKRKDLRGSDPMPWS